MLYTHSHKGKKNYQMFYKLPWHLANKDNQTIDLVPMIDTNEQNLGNHILEHIKIIHPVRVGFQLGSNRHEHSSTRSAKETRNGKEPVDIMVHDEWSQSTCTKWWPITCTSKMRQDYFLPLLFNAQSLTPEYKNQHAKEDFADSMFRFTPQHPLWLAQNCL